MNFLPSSSSFVTNATNPRSQDPDNSYQGGDFSTTVPRKQPTVSHEDGELPKPLPLLPGYDVYRNVPMQQGSLFQPFHNGTFPSQEPLSTEEFTPEQRVLLDQWATSAASLLLKQLQAMQPQQTLTQPLMQSASQRSPSMHRQQHEEFRRRVYTGLPPTRADALGAPMDLSSSNGVYSLGTANTTAPGPIRSNSFSVSSLIQYRDQRRDNLLSSGFSPSSSVTSGLGSSLNSVDLASSDLSSSSLSTLSQLVSMANVTLDGEPAPEECPFLSPARADEEAAMVDVESVTPPPPRLEQQAKLVNMHSARSITPTPSGMSQPGASRTQTAPITTTPQPRKMYSMQRVNELNSMAPYAPPAPAATLQTTIRPPTVPSSTTVPHNLPYYQYHPQQQYQPQYSMAAQQQGGPMYTQEGQVLQQPLQSLHAQAQHYNPILMASALNSAMLNEQYMRQHIMREICAVCNDRASGYHYGVQSCEGCKGFFRRAVAKEMEYECLKANDCVMDKRMRVRCPACRLKKCYAVGMVKGALKQGWKKNKRKTEEEAEDREQRNAVVSRVQECSEVADACVRAYEAAFPESLRLVSEEDLRHRLRIFASHTVCPQRQPLSVQMTFSQSIGKVAVVRAAFTRDDCAALNVNREEVETMRTVLNIPGAPGTCLPLPLSPKILGICLAIIVVIGEDVRDSPFNLKDLCYYLNMNLAMANAHPSLYTRLQMALVPRTEQIQ